MKHGLAFGIVRNIADQRRNLDLFARTAIFSYSFFSQLKVKQNGIAQRADSGKCRSVNIFALHEFLQVEKYVVPGCENDGKPALSTGFMKQFRLHGCFTYSWPRPLFRRLVSTLSSCRRCFRSCATPTIRPNILRSIKTAQKIVRAIAHSNTSSHGSRTTIVSLATISFGSDLAASLVE